MTNKLVLFLEFQKCSCLILFFNNCNIQFNNWPKEKRAGIRNLQSKSNICLIKFSKFSLVAFHFFLYVVLEFKFVIFLLHLIKKTQFNQID